MSDVNWDAIIKRANATRKALDEKPRHLRVGYSLHPGSILNAYREGDATFAEAVEAIRAIGTAEVERLRAMRDALVKLRDGIDVACLDDGWSYVERINAVLKIGEQA